MKKIISLLSISTIVAATSMTLVSCNFGVDRYSKIYVITDAGKIQDKSFNQSGFLGGNKFINNALDLGDKSEISYAQPSSITDAPWMYSQAFRHGAKSLILPGFKHANFINEANAEAADAGGSVIFVDGVSGGMKNTIGLSYRSDISGLWAGIASIMHILKTGQTPVLSTFGGMHNALAVDPFMAGFLASVEVYNTMRQTEQEKIVSVAKTFGLDKSILDKEAKIVKAQENGYGEHGQWFTDSFDPGKGSDLSETLLIQNGANVIMPVAGPQTADALKVLTENNLGGKSFVVGVDTNQVEMYNTYSEFFITSAEKDISGSSALALAHSGVFDEEMESAKNKLNLDQNGYNERLDDMGNNLSVTKKEGNDYKEVFTGLTNEEITENSELLYLNDWRGMDLWLGGSISVSGSNKVNDEQLQAIKDIFEDASTMASIEYFDFVTTTGNDSASKTLSKEIISDYAKNILNNLNKREANYGDFLTI